MKPIANKLAAALVALGIVLGGTGCSTAASLQTKPGTAPTPSTQETATPRPAQTASPAPADTPAPPTPIPSPTPAPDPWAQYFTTDGAHLTIGDADIGPWAYRDEALSIHVDLIKVGNRKYCRAEIFTRGPLPFGGFADRDTTGRRRALPYLIDRQYQAVLGITGDFVAHHGNPKGVMIRDGKIYYDKQQAPTMAFLPDGDMKVYEPGETNAKALLALGVQNSFAFGPILVKDGKIHKSVYTHRLKPGNWRAAIGQVEKGHYICIVTISGFTLAETAKLFIDNHCTVAYNLDGGHSASIVFMGEQLYRGGRGKDNMPQRSLCDMVLFGVSPAVPGVNAPVYCNGLSKNAKYRPAPTDGPIE